MIGKMLHDTKIQGFISSGNTQIDTDLLKKTPEKTDSLKLNTDNIGEVGPSYMGGAYNKFEEDGLVLDKKRKVKVYAVDFNTKLPTKTFVNGEWAWVNVDVPETYTEQFGRKQQGGFIDFVQPIIKKSWFGFENSTLNAALRLEYVDWNRGKFKSTGGSISDHVFFYCSCH